jgi:hypothetical protein
MFIKRFLFAFSFIAARDRQMSTRLIAILRRTAVFQQAGCVIGAFDWPAPLAHHAGREPAAQPLGTKGE